MEWSLQISKMENKKYQQALIQQAKLQNTFYNYTTLQPCAYFWKQLLKGKQTPSLLVPDTLIMNDKQTPMIWMYTNSKGKLEKSTNINFKDFVNKITNYCSPNQLAATLKRVTYNDHYINGNDVKLLNARYLQNASFQQLGGQSETLITLQRYIKSNGNNPFICRTIWRKEKHSECFIITNKKSYFDENEPQAKRFIVKVAEPTKGQPSPSRIVKAIQGKHLTETCKYLGAITDFMKLYRGVNFSQMVGDFIKDEAGNWWLINIKAFQVENKLIRNPSSNLTPLEATTNFESIQYGQKQGNSQPYEKQKYQKTKICRYCEKAYLESQLTHYMTTRMLIETDRYLLHLGKDYKWLRRSDIQNVDSHCLYQEHKICERCYRLYMEIQSLMEVENVFLKRLGFQLENKPKELLMNLTNQEELKSESKNKELLALASCFQNPKQFNSHNEQHSKFPKVIELGPNSNIIFENDIPIKNDHMINTMIRYRMILYLKELDQVQFPDFLKDEYLCYNFFLEYELFGAKNKIKLDFNSNYCTQKKVLVIKKLKINYFFSHSHQDVHQYLNNQDEDFAIKIFAEPKSNKHKIENTNRKNRSTVKKSSAAFGGSETQKSMQKSVKISKKPNNQNESSPKGQFSKRINLGKLRLPVKQFFNNMVSNNSNKITKKDFYKFFSVNEVPHGWGLQGSIGVIPSEGDVTTSRMIFFTNDNLIYLPNENYYYCEHLPEEWIDVMKQELNEGVRHPSSASQNVAQNEASPLNVPECVSEKTYTNLPQNFNLKQEDPDKLILKETQNIEEKIRSSMRKQRSPNKKKSLMISIFRNSPEAQLDSEPTIEQEKEKQVFTQPVNSWKDMILKEEIEKYEKTNQKGNMKKEGSRTNLSKVLSRTRLY